MVTSPSTQFAPHMRDYYRMGTISHPFLMYFHELNFRSRSVNTDGYGLRVSTDREGRIVSLDNLHGADCSLFVGGSTAFGVGATSDALSIPSLLSKETGQTWLNFSGRSFSSTQEFILFTLYRHKLGRVANVVLFSGFNNLTVFAAGKTFPVNLGGFYYWAQARKGLPDPYLSRFQAWVRSRLIASLGDTVRWRDVNWLDAIRYLYGIAPPSDECDERGSLYVPIKDRSAQKELMLISQRRDLENWAMVAKGLGFKITFILQPFALWAQRTATAVEAQIFAESAKTPRPQFDFLSGADGREIYKWWQAALKAMCAELGISFYNANDAVKSAPADEWIWVDRAHLTDAANKILAPWVAQRI